MFKISDEDIMSFVKESLEKESRERGLLKERKGQGSLDAGCGDVPKWPSLELDKMVGKPSPQGSGAREVLQNISITGDTVPERVNSLQASLSRTLDEAAKSGSLEEQFANFIFLDSIYKLADAQRNEPLVAGLMLEPILAAVLGGVQKGGPSEIIDIDFGLELNDKEMENGISLKFIKEKSKVTGSLLNFLSALMRRSQFYFVALTKGFSSEDQSLTIGFHHRLVQAPEGLEEAVVKAYYNYIQFKSDTEGLTVTSNDIKRRDTNDAFSIISSVPTAERSAFAIKVTQEFLGEERFQSVLGLMNMEGNNLPEKPKIQFDIKTGTYSSVQIPSPDKLRQIAEQKINTIDRRISRMYNELGKLSCVMKNYIRYPKISSSELGKTVGPIAGTIKGIAIDISTEGGNKPKGRYSLGTKE
jgi:hypothetical protein